MSRASRHPSRQLSMFRNPYDVNRMISWVGDDGYNDAESRDDLISLDVESQHAEKQGWSKRDLIETEEREILR